MAAGVAGTDTVCSPIIVTSVALPAGIGQAKKSHILLDNQSSVHIFHNLRLLKKPLSWSRSPLHLGGIVEGQVLKTNRIGSFLDIALCNVWYSTKSAANILSLHQLSEDGHPTIYDENKDSFSVSTPNDGVLVFDWDNDIEHYVCNFDQHVRQQREEKVGKSFTTIAENAKKYPESKGRLKLLNLRVIFFSAQDSRVRVNLKS